MPFLSTVAWVVLAVIFVPYLLHHLLLGFCKGRDLKKRYNAEWALVTGASSGVPFCAICVQSSGCPVAGSCHVPICVGLSTIPLKTEGFITVEAREFEM